MASKNASPFLVQTWHEDGWTDGWTIAKPYKVGGKSYLFMLKSLGYGGDDKNVHICLLESDGDLGPKKFTEKWTQGWTSAEFYEAGGKTYLLILKALGFGSDGNNIHIHNVGTDGSISNKQFVKKVDQGLTQCKVYSVGGSKYLFLLKSNDGTVDIYRITDDGNIGPKTATYNWSSGWTGLEVYIVANCTYLFLMKRDGGAVHINKLKNDGTVGERVATYDWSDGWTHAKAFHGADRPYILLLKSGTGVVHINHLKDDGTVGQHVCQYARDPSDYTTAFETGSLADWGPRPWTAGWTTVEFTELGGKPYLFALKRELIGNQEKRAKLYRVNPMQSVGPMVSYVATDRATIWVGSVGININGTVQYQKGGGPTLEVALDFASDGEYYRAGVALLLGLEPDTTYSYNVILDNKQFGSGAFKTSPPMQRGTFRVAVVSCMDLHRDRKQLVWNHVQKQGPSLMLQIGDNAYPNTTMRSMIWAEHLQQRGVESFAETIRQVPSLATWDDHDFGPNNSAGADVEKDNRTESQKTFRELFPGLPFAALEGIYYKARWGDVDFFVLDNRFFRNHYKNGSPLNRAMLGTQQWTWLEQSVKTSNARFKVIVSGTTINSNATETWVENYPAEWFRLKKLALENNGVLVVSGDIHKCRADKHAIDQNRKLFEIISSGIAGPYGNEHAFVTLDFDTTVVGKEKVTCRLFRQDGTERHDGRTILLSEIS